MKRLTLALTVLLLLSGCGDNDDIDLALLALMSQDMGPSLHAAGVAATADKLIACHWTDGRLTELEHPANLSADSIYTALQEDGHTYIVGVLKDNAAGRDYIAIWIDGVLDADNIHDVINIETRHSFTLQNGTVHGILERYFDGGGSDYLQYWQWNSQDGFVQEIANANLDADNDHEYKMAYHSLSIQGDQLVWCGYNQETNKAPAIFKLSLTDGTRQPLLRSPARPAAADPHLGHDGQRHLPARLDHRRRTGHR